MVKRWQINKNEKFCQPKGNPITSPFVSINRMISMQKFIMMLSLMLVISGCTRARTQKLESIIDTVTPELRAGILTMIMKRELKLTADQENAVKEMNLRYTRKSDEIIRTSKRDLQTFRRLHKHMKKKDAELKDILTHEQFKIYEKKKEEFRKKVKQFRKERKKTNSGQGLKFKVEDLK